MKVPENAARIGSAVLAFTGGGHAKEAPGCLALPPSPPYAIHAPAPEAINETKTFWKGNGVAVLPIDAVSIANRGKVPWGHYPRPVHTPTAPAGQTETPIVPPLLPPDISDLDANALSELAIVLGGVVGVSGVVYFAYRWLGRSKKTDKGRERHPAVRRPIVSPKKPPENPPENLNNYRYFDPNSDGR